MLFRKGDNQVSKKNVVDTVQPWKNIILMGDRISFDKEYFNFTSSISHKSCNVYLTLLFLFLKIPQTD